jgi:hypothetical protein
MDEMEPTEETEQTDGVTHEEVEPMSHILLEDEEEVEDELDDEEDDEVFYSFDQPQALHSQRALTDEILEPLETDEVDELPTTLMDNKVEVHETHEVMDESVELEV